MPLPLINIHQELTTALGTPGAKRLTDRRPKAEGGRSPGQKAKLGAALIALGKELTDAARAEVDQANESEDSGVTFKPRTESRQYRVNTAEVKRRFPRSKNPGIYFEKVLRPIVAVHLPFRTKNDDDDCAASDTA